VPRGNVAGVGVSPDAGEEEAVPCVCLTAANPDALLDVLYYLGPAVARALLSATRRPVKEWPPSVEADASFPFSPPRTAMSGKAQSVMLYELFYSVILTIYK
jgi:hypothetical protein